MDVVLPEDAQLEVIGWVHSIVKQIGMYVIVF